MTTNGEVLMKKTKVFAIILLTVIIGLSGCRKPETNGTTPGPQPPQTITIAALKGPTAMGMARMIQEYNALSNRLAIRFDILPSPSIAAAGLVSGEYAIATIPTNMAAILYHQTEGNIRLLAVNTLGNLFLVTRENAGISSLADLRGKEMLSSGLGAVPEIILDYLLEYHGLKSGTDVMVDYKTQHTEVATLFLAGEADIVLLPQPFVSLVLQQDPSAVLAVDLTLEWEKATGGLRLPMGCVVARADFVEQFPEELKAFLETYRETMEWVLAHPEQAAPGIVALEILPNEEVAIQALGNSNIVFYTASESREMLESFFQILLERNPALVGGSLPGENLYLP